MMHWKSIDETAGLWTYGRVQDGVCVLRSTALRLDGGDLAVIGPVRETAPEAYEELRALGRPAFLLATNHFHNLGLAAYARRYDDCTVVASDAASRRLSRKTPVPIAPLGALRDRLGGSMTLLEPPGTRTGEVWLRAETGRGVAWVVGDAFFNMPRTPRTPTGLIMRLMGAAPGLRIGPTFLRIALNDRPAYAAWLARRIETDRPTTLIPAHGDIDDGANLAERLTALAAARLPAVGGQS